MASSTIQRTPTSAPGASMADTAREMASSVGETAKGAAATATQMAGDAASYVGKKAETAATAVGGGIKSLGNTLESGGRYLEQHGLGGIGDDLTNLIRRNPVPALLVGIGVGFLIARATRT